MPLLRGQDLTLSRGCAFKAFKPRKRNVTTALKAYAAFAASADKGAVRILPE